MSKFTSTGAKGAASEMFACAHLLSQGYHVFRSVSPACPVDGVAYRAGELIRFEVKTLVVQPSCTFVYPTNDEWDLLLLVTSAGAVHEFRPPSTAEEIRDAVREVYGMPPAPKRGRRGEGSQKYYPPANPKREIVCGTWAAYCRHKTNRTPVCDACEAARGRFVEDIRKRQAEARALRGPSGATEGDE